jgi:hypothetical protein
VIYQQMISDLVCEECVSECLSDWELNETSWMDVILTNKQLGQE